MARERGASNIRRLNDEREERYLKLIEDELVRPRTRRLDFKNIDVLIEYVADSTGIHRTTFKRNPKYFKLLSKHLRVQPGAVNKVDDSTDDPFVLRSKLLVAKAEVSNLKQEVKKLTARLSIYPEELPMFTGQPSQAMLDVANLAMLLCLVLERLDGSVEVAVDARALLDLAAKPSERIIAGPERAAAFISWLERNQGLPLVQRILRR